MKVKNQTLKFDVMLGHSWVATMTMPLVPEHICDYVGEMPVVSEETVKRFIESRRPSLIGKEYEIWPVTKSVGELFRTNKGQ